LDTTFRRFSGCNPPLPPPSRRGIGPLPRGQFKPRVSRTPQFIVFELPNWESRGSLVSHLDFGPFCPYVLPKPELRTDSQLPRRPDRSRLGVARCKRILRVLILCEASSKLSFAPVSVSNSLLFPWPSPPRFFLPALQPPAFRFLLKGRSGLLPPCPEIAPAVVRPSAFEAELHGKNYVRNNTTAFFFSVFFWRMALFFFFLPWFEFFILQPNPIKGEFFSVSKTCYAEPWRVPFRSLLEFFPSRGFWMSFLHLTSSFLSFSLTVLPPLNLFRRSCASSFQKPS